MKLVDILARELAEWPEGVSKLTQSFAGMVFYQDSAQQIVPLGRMEISDDLRDEYVTRAEWKSAVDALNAPKVVEWDGVGLPPIGAEIEALLQGIGSATYFWQRAKVVHGALPESGSEILVFSLETTRPAWVDEFRPIRTQEQIAEEERNKEIDELVELFVKHYEYPKGAEQYLSICTAIHDAGYRNQVAK